MLPVVTHATDRCRRCYSCVRGCPAKAIRVREGQAELMADRCVGCGRCVKVCSQNIKRIASNLSGVKQTLFKGNAVIMLAPSFPAAFPQWSPGQFIASLRELGFKAIYEVAFGADLVSQAYAKLYAEKPHALHITTPCPAAVSFIRKYAHELVPSLTPIASPMTAMGRLIKSRLRPGADVVFAGPCTAKMREAEELTSASGQRWTDVVTTFDELIELLCETGIDPASLSKSDFDPPHARMGSLYPLAGGLLDVVGLPTGITETSVTHVCGSKDFANLVEQLRRDVRDNLQLSTTTRFFDVLFCKGCIDGPVMGDPEHLMRRKELVVAYLKEREQQVDISEWQSQLDKHADLDLAVEFQAERMDGPEPTESEIREILRRTHKETVEQELNCGACGYRSCREKAMAVAKGLAEIDMCLPFMIDRLEATIESLHSSHEQLTEAQTQLIRSERLASMGQMAAGIAHEVNNPLGTILIYAHLLKETEDCPESIRKDVDMILHEATRCRNIVGGLLNFARQNKVSLGQVSLRELLEEAVEVITPQAGSDFSIIVDVDSKAPHAAIDRDQIHQVLVNLLRNAIEACNGDGVNMGTSGAGSSRERVIRLSGHWNAIGREFRISVRDSGPGIAPENMSKLFSPFFSTKPVGKGTGLGLPICYGIIKMHRGTIRAMNNTDGPGATFEICFPDLSSQVEGYPL